MKGKNGILLFVEFLKGLLEDIRIILFIINWIYKELFQSILKKYSLRIRQIEIEAITVTEAERQLIIEICNPTALKTSCKFAMYQQKELCNMSDKAYQSFINAGAIFSSLRFSKKCAFYLDSEFRSYSNDYGKF